MNFLKTYAFIAAVEEMLAKDSLEEMHYRHEKYDNEIPFKFHALYFFENYQTDINHIKENIHYNGMDITWNQLDIFRSCKQNCLRKIRRKKESDNTSYLCTGWA